MTGQITRGPLLCGVKHTAPYFDDNSSKRLEELADFVAFLKLL
jgi:hypothetical protein